MCIPFTHFWLLAHVVGDIATYQCVKCPKTKIRVKSCRQG